MKPHDGVPPTLPDDEADAKAVAEPNQRAGEAPPRAATTVDDDGPVSTQPDDGDTATEAAVLRLLEATRGPARPLRLVGDLTRGGVALAITFVAWQGLLRVSNTGAGYTEPTRTLLPMLLGFVVARLIFRITGHRFVRPLRGFR